MRDQPKPTTGEWTTQMVADIVEARKDVSVCVSVSDAHNAALAAERELGQQECNRLDAFWQNEVARQLAAEREKVQPLVDALEWAWTIIANAGGGNWTKESQYWQDAAAKWRDEAWHPALAKVKVGK